jgi:hypothetical protein
MGRLREVRKRISPTLILPIEGRKDFVEREMPVR